MHQLPLFPLTQPPLAPTDPHVSPDDVPRLSGQCAELLEMLRAGPVTNGEMVARGMMKYTSRISDLRKHGHRITCERRPGGVSVYWLE